jgi:hypothetical protein
LSIVTQVNNALTRIGTEFKSVRTSIGSLASLSTTNKNSVVEAVNEVRGLVGNAGAQINDATPATGTVYSSSQTEARISAAVAALVGAAPGTLDTLSELSDALGDDPNAITTLTTAVGNRVRFDAAQTLTAPQATQARTNIGAISAADVGDPNTDFVATFVAALA